jgi:hypothetical protein
MRSFAMAWLVGRLASGASALVASAPGRIVAVGDLHGDFQAAVRVLRSADLLDDEGHWAGKDTTLVQLGDVLDRGGEEAEVWSLLDRLTQEAALAGGQVFRLLGNHEVLNALGKANNYIHYRGRTSFGSDRVAAFKPGSALATELATWPVALIIDDTVFVHASLPYDATRERLTALNEKTSAWLRGEGACPPSLLGGLGSPVWCRSVSSPSDFEPAPNYCASLRAALDRVGCKRVVVGHTPQSIINSACEEAIWRCDTGMSRSVCGGTCEALEITATGVRVLAEAGGSRPASLECMVDSLTGESVVDSLDDFS